MNVNEVLTALQAEAERWATSRNWSEEDLSGPRLVALARAAGCNWGTYWKVDAVRRVLTPSGHWNDGQLHADRLKVNTLSRSLTPSEGTAGHVWRSGKPVWTANLIADMCLPRSLEASEAGLHGGLWFAVKTADSVYGVVELLGTGVPHPTQSDLDALELIGARLGCAIGERRTEKPQRPC